MFFFLFRGVREARKERASVGDNHPSVSSINAGPVRKLSDDLYFRDLFWHEVEGRRARAAKVKFNESAFDTVLVRQSSVDHWAATVAADRLAGEANR